MTHKISLASLRVGASRMPAGYYESVLSMGRVEGDVLFLEQDAYSELEKKYAPKPKPASFAQKARNLAGASARVVRATAKGEAVTVSEDEKNRRLSLCHACQYYNGLSCNLCGCIVNWKTKLATEHCPLPEPKW